MAGQGSSACGPVPVAGLLVASQERAGPAAVSDRDHFALMVVPPDTEPDAARAAMARAVQADDVTQAAEILVAALPSPMTEPEGPA